MLKCKKEDCLEVHTQETYFKNKSKDSFRNTKVDELITSPADLWYQETKKKLNNVLEKKENGTD